jgi:hypothetical protein
LAIPSPVTPPPDGTYLVRVRGARRVIRLRTTSTGALVVLTPAGRWLGMQNPAGAWQGRPWAREALQAATGHQAAAAAVCPTCGKALTDRRSLDLLAAGRWVCERERRPA